MMVRLIPRGPHDLPGVPLVTGMILSTGVSLLLWSALWVGYRLLG
jgi:hypothetical protein